MKLQISLQFSQQNLEGGVFERIKLRTPFFRCLKQIHETGRGGFSLYFEVRLLGEKFFLSNTKGFTAEIFIPLVYLHLGEFKN